MTEKFSEIWSLNLKDGVDKVFVSPMSENYALDSQEHPLASPHRHDYYSCFFLRRGAIELEIDFSKITVQAPAIVILPPYRVHKINRVSGTEGWVTTCDEKMIDQNARLIFERSSATTSVIPIVNGDDIVWFNILFSVIHKTQLDGPVGSSYWSVMQYLTNALLVKVASLVQLSENHNLTQFSVRSVEIVMTFQNLMKESYKTIKRPVDYASRMNISASYLNDQVKAVTGQSVTRIIQNEVMGEAQRQLYYTTKSVKEIAYLLGYEDFKYFIRLFTKVAGISPSAFRKTNF